MRDTNTCHILSRHLEKLGGLGEVKENEEEGLLFSFTRTSPLLPIKDSFNLENQQCWLDCFVALTRANLLKIACCAG